MTENDGRTTAGPGLRLALAGALAIGLTGAARAPNGRAADGAALIALEKASWVAWKDHDADFYRRFLSDDHIEIHGGGLANKAEVVSQVREGCTVKSYTLGDIRINWLGRDAAVLVYRAAQDTACGQGRAPSPVWVTSGYARVGGRWVNSVYGHTPITGAAATQP